MFNDAMTENLQIKVTDSEERYKKKALKAKTTVPSRAEPSQRQFDNFNVPERDTSVTQATMSIQKYNFFLIKKTVYFVYGPLFSFFSKKKKKC